MSGNSASRLQFIDSLRLLAAVLVLVQHIFEQHREVPGFSATVQLAPGLIGVIIFFLVSGYVVPMSVRTPFRPLSFMIRRLFRIYPLLLSAFALLLVLGSTGVLARWSFMAHAGPAQWAANFLLSWGIFKFPPFLGVAWTLVIEFVWYVLFATTFARWGDRAGIVLAAVVPLGLLAFTAISFFTGVRLPLGLANMVYACVLGYLAFMHDRKLISWRFLALNFAAFFAVNWISNFVAYGVFSHQDLTLAQALWAWLLGLLAFFGVVLWPRLRAASLLNHGVLPVVGAASYSVYLLHPLGLAAGQQYGGGTASNIALVLLVTAVLATIGYIYIELPGIALGRRVAALLERPRAVSAAVQA